MPGSAAASCSRAARHPDRALIEALNARRRERYASLRQQGKSDAYVVFPPSDSRGREAQTSKVNGKVTHANTAPAADGQDAAHEPVAADVGETSAANALAHDAPADKAQKGMSAHVLARLLALRFIVPLCQLDDSGLPNHVSETDYTALDAIKFLQSFVRDQAESLGHAFLSRPAGSMTSSAYESTTFDTWLLPRLLSAASVLGVRQAGLLPSSDEVSAVQDALLDLAHDILDTSIGDLRRLSTVRCILAEMLRASIAALSLLSHPSFLSCSPPPMWLTPKQHAGERSSLLSFFNETGIEDDRYSTMSTTKQSGNGIARLWLAEDHTTFDLIYDNTKTDETVRHLFIENCFSMSVGVCLRLSRNHPGELLDLAATAAELLESNWKCSTRLQRYERTGGHDANDTRDCLRLCAASSAANEVVADRFAVLIVRQLELSLASEKPLPSSRLIGTLQDAASRLRCLELPSGTMPPELLGTLGSISHLLVERCLKHPESLTTSAVPNHKEERDRRDREMQLTMLAASMLISYLEASEDPQTSLDMEDRRALIEGLELELSETQVSEEAPSEWMPPEMLAKLSALLLGSQLQGTERGSEAHEMASIPRFRKIDSRQGLQDVFENFEVVGPAEDLLRNASCFLSCVDAGTLFCATLSARRAQLQCSVCDDAQVKKAASDRQEQTAQSRSNWRLDALTALLADRRKLPEGQRDPLRSVIKRAFNHRPASVDSINGHSLSFFARSGLTLSKRSERLVMGAAIAQVTSWLHEASQFKGREAALRAEVVKLFDVIANIMSEKQVRLKETALLATAALASLKLHEVRQRALAILISQLSSDTFSKGVAYNSITHLASKQGCTTFQLLSPFLDVIGVEVVEQMSQSPVLFLEVLQLTKQNQSKFLRTTLPFVLPRLLQSSDRKTLELVAKGVGSDVQTLCFSHAAPILKSILMQIPPSRRDRSLHIFLDSVRGGEAQDINIKSLVKAYSVELLGHLVSHLGSESHHKAAIEGLHYVNTVLNERTRTNKSAASRDQALSAFLKDEVLAILSWYNEELMDVHGKRSVTHKAMVTRSIGMLVHLIGEKVSNVTPQLLATFNTTMQIPDLVSPSLESWLALVTTLSPDNLGPCVGPTVAALVTSWPSLRQAEKQAGEAILTHIIVDSPSELRPYLERDLPDLDAIKDDIPEVWQKLAANRNIAKRGTEQRLKNIVSRAATDNSSMCLQALTELKAFVRSERIYIESITSGNAFDPLATRLVSVVLQCVSRDDEGTSSISLEILGAIGAIDPDRMASMEQDTSSFVLHDFQDKEALTDFAVHLVKSVLVGAFKATNDTKHQAALAFAMQELLKLSGFSAALLPGQDGSGGRGSIVNLRTRQRWNSLADYIDTLAPLLESKYSVQHGEMTLREKPFYKHASGFKEWVQTWTNDLIIGAPGDMANALFSVFRSAIRDHDLSIAQCLLPHLVVDVITLGSETQYWEIHGEIVAVLEDQVQLTSAFSEEHRLLSAQVIFGILDHLSVWQRSRRRDRQRSIRQKRDPVDAALGQIDKLMNAISYDLMAKASLRCRAYARSLLNFEQRIRQLQKDVSSSDNLQRYYEDLHLVYANLDEPDGMEGVSTLVLKPSLEHQIREHESTGRWTSAQSCWEVKIQGDPNDLALHTGLLGCLRNLGHYDTLRTHVRGVLAVHPDWADALDPFYVEGSSILSDWAEVGRVLGLEDKRDAETVQRSTARVMLAMHNGDTHRFKTAVAEARNLFGKPLVAAQRGGYAGVYRSISQLHMLHELELIGSALGILDGQEHAMPFAELAQVLDARLESTSPSFRFREPLLSLRRSAFNTRKHPDVQQITAQTWITSSKVARRAGHLQTAYSAALQAASWSAPLAVVQHAKLLAHEDKAQAALHELSSALTQIPTPVSSNVKMLRSYANAHLFVARLSETSGRGRANEIIELYKKCTELDPHCEKMWYHLGHYYDQYTERDMRSLSNTLVQHYNVCRNYMKAATYGTKFFYRTMPRVLTIWLMHGDNESFLAHMRRNKPSTNGTSARLDPDVEHGMKVFAKLNEAVHKHIDRIGSYQWLAVLPQLMSRVTHKNDVVWKTLREVICRVLRSHTDQAMWAMLAGSQSKDKERRTRVLEMIGAVKASASHAPPQNKISDTIEQMLLVGKELLYLCDFPLAKDTKQLNMKSDFFALMSLAQKGAIIVPLQSSLQVSMPSNGKALSSHQVFDENLPTIVDLEQTIEILSSLQRPRKIVLKASNGQSYAFLCKPKDDLRKDARLMEFDAMINNLLQSNSESRKRHLYIRTYSVVTLNEECGLIEWVPNTIGLRHILNSLYASRGIALYSQVIKTDLDAARADPKRASDIFEAKVLSKYPSVFHEWFIAMFPEPSAWLAARLNYGRTLAVMSMVGHVLGLGDRHGENILFDSVSGDTVHVDLNCLFDKGTTFEIPERVPFRLTHNLVDALGVTRCEGVFRRAAEIAMSILRDNKDSLMSVLEAMIHDPLVEWGNDDRSSKARTGTAAREDPRMVEARKSLDPVRSKLDGNLKRQAFHDPFAPTTNLSTNSLVDALIREATSSTNLALMCECECLHYLGYQSADPLEFSC